MSSKVLVTGGSGYLGTQLIAALLRDGREVRATARSLDLETGVREAVRRGSADDSGLELVTADLTSDDGWPAVLEGVEEVHHAASPIPSAQPKNPGELIVPAREGTVRVLRAARDAGAHRVVLTSSFAAVGYSPKAVRDYTEADWTDPDTPGLPPYPRSKAIAERAAWDFIRAEGGDTQLVVMNPTFIAGPSLVPALRSSLTYFKAIIEGTMPALPASALASSMCATSLTRTSRQWHLLPPPGSAICCWRTARRSPGWGWPRSSATTSGPQAVTSQLTRCLARTRHHSRSATIAPNRSSAGNHGRPRPRSSRPPKASASSACWRNT